MCSYFWLFVTALRSPVEVHEHVDQTLQVISLILLNALVGVDGGIAGRFMFSQ
jgi:hypothetical protein